MLDFSGLRYNCVFVFLYIHISYLYLRFFVKYTTENVKYTTVIIYYRKSAPRVIINQKITTTQRKKWLLWKGDKVTGSQYLLANNDLPKILSVIHWQVLITYIFSVFLKFWTCYITVQWRDFTGNNATLYLHILSWRFLMFFIEKFVFIFIYFLMKYQICATDC